MIARLSRYQIGQVVRDDGPKSHLPKAGTPTMGGALILVAILFGTLLWADLSNRFVWTVLGVTFAFGLIGFYDDYLKLVVGNSKGLAARWKYFWQSVAGLGDRGRRSTTPRRARRRPRCSCRSSSSSPRRSRAFGFIAFTYLMIVGMSNAVNLTDGLDGLAIMPAALVAAALGVFAYASGNAVFANYLSIPADPACRRGAHLLRGAGGRGPRLPVVQRLSRAGVHGRHRRARHRRGASA